MLDYNKPHLTYYPNRRRAQVAVIALGVCALISMLTLVQSLMMNEFLQRAGNGNYSKSEATTLDDQARTLALFDAGAYLVTSIAFLFWLHRAYKNHEQFARHGAEYSSHWVVLGFIIPFINWVRPYQLVREMWDESQAAASDDPFATQSTHLLIIVWWLSFLAMNFGARLSSTFADTADSIAELTSAVNLDLVVQVITIVSAILAKRIVQKIDVRHEARWRQAPSTDNFTERTGWSPLLYAWPIGISVLIAGLVWFGSGTLINKNKPAVASAPTAKPTRPTAISQSAGKKPTVTPAKSASLASAPSHQEELGQEYLDAGEYEKAVEAFSQALKDDPASEARLYYLRGITYSRSEDYETALTDLSQSLKVDPQYLEAYYERGMAHFHLGNYGLASKDFDQALKLDADYSEAYIGRGYTSLAQEDYAPALTDFNQAMQLDDTAAEAYFGRGLVYYDTNEYLKAMRDFSQTLELDDEWADAYYRRGMTHYELENQAAARRDFDRAVALEPNYIDPYFDRGLLLIDLGQYQAALADLDKVVKAYPEEGLAYLWRGVAYTKLNETEKAITDLEQAVKWSIDANVRREAEDVLKELKGEKRSTS